MKNKWNLLTCILLLCTISLYGQQTISVEAATTQLENTVNSLLPGDLRVSDVSSDGTNANCVVMGVVPLNGGLNLSLSATFTADADNSSVVLIGTAEGVTTSKLVTALGGNASELPSNFSNANLGDVELTLSPGDGKVTASFNSPVGTVQIERTEEGVQFGVTPNNLSSLGFNDISLEGFKLVYFSPNQAGSTQEEKATTSLLLLSDVPVEKGLNAFWTGKLPQLLRELPLIDFIPDIDNVMTFSGRVNIVDGAPELPSLSIPISFPGGFKQGDFKFDNLEFKLEPKDENFGFSGDITCDIGETLVFNSSLMAGLSNGELEGKISLVQVGSEIIADGWNEPFGIPGLNITDLYITTTPTGLSLGGEAEFGTVDGNEILMSLELGSSKIKATAAEISIIGFINAFADIGAFGDLPDISIKNASIEVNTNTKIMSLNGEGDIFGLKPTIKLTASNIIDVANSSYEMEASFDFEKLNAFRDDIINEVQSLIPSSLSFLSSIIDDLLAIEINKFGLSASIEPGNAAFKMGVDFESNIVDFKKDIALNDDLLEKIATDIYKELKDGLNDFWEGLVGAGEAAMEISGNVWDLASSPEDWGDAAADPIGTVYGLAGAQSTSIDLPGPSNGDGQGYVPQVGFEHYRLTLKSFKTIALGEESGGGNNNLEINGNITITSPEIYFNQGANPFLFNIHRLTEIECPLNQEVRIDNQKDIYLSVLNNDIVSLSIDLGEREGGNDMGDLFAQRQITINRTGGGHTAPTNFGEPKSYDIYFSVKGQRLVVSFELERMSFNTGAFSIIAQQGTDGGKVFLNPTESTVQLIDKPNNTDGPKWELVQRSENKYEIRSVLTPPLPYSTGDGEMSWTDRVLSTPLYHHPNGTISFQKPGVGMDMYYTIAHLWELEELENGYYHIKNLNGKNLSFSANGLSLLPSNSSSLSQRWYIGNTLPSCNDGRLNQGETAIDCGGPNCNPCPTCSDGIMNQGETGVDCGGPICAPCVNYSYGTVTSPVNLALGKKTWQSSDYGGPSSQAVDGNTDGDYYNSSITHTNKQQGAYWQVDLGAVYDITTVQLYNRTDCCAERLDNYSIYVTDNGNWNHATLFADHEPYSPETVRTFEGQRKGRYIRVRLNGNDYLSLAEVKVFGEAIVTQYESGQPSVGQIYEGAMICHVNEDGKSGLLVTPDIGLSSLAEAEQYVEVARSAWRLPTAEELSLMLSSIGPQATGPNQNIGNFSNSPFAVYRTTTWAWNLPHAKWGTIPDSYQSLHRFVKPFRIE